ncbi:MAG: hypothetical protein Salg2KO_14190 [Salibacteraceae bacterium]
MTFPVYRKYTNGQSLFKIVSHTEFIELKRFRNSWDRYEFEAKIFPDKQLIADMIEMRDALWVEVDGMEFELISNGLPEL